MAETKADKALRYVAERRLLIEHVDPALIKATCRGDSGEVHTLGWRSDQQRWGCTCEANATFHRRCSHLIALQLVTVKPHQVPRDEGAEQRHD